MVGNSTTKSVQSIALPSFDHAMHLNSVASLGIDAIEVAPSRIWRDTWHGLTSSKVSKYRRNIKDAGLGVVGLHSLFKKRYKELCFQEKIRKKKVL